MFRATMRQCRSPSPTRSTSARRPTGQVLNTQAPFQATINGGYEIPFSDAFGGYFRFNLNYQGNNPNFGNFRTGGAFKSTPVLCDC